MMDKYGRVSVAALLLAAAGILVALGAMIGRFAEWARGKRDKARELKEKTKKGYKTTVSALQLLDSALGFVTKKPKEKPEPNPLEYRF